MLINQFIFYFFTTQIVQAALDKASMKRSCIMISHRLSTVRNADIIYVLQDGEIVEKGTHLELIDKNAVYHGFVELLCI